MIALVRQRSGPDVEENIERGARSFADCDFDRIPGSAVKRHFLRDRRPGAFGRFGLTDGE
jgi:hypothetical protein